MNAQEILTLINIFCAVTVFLCTLYVARANKPEPKSIDEIVTETIKSDAKRVSENIMRNNAILAKNRG
jgi:hypothetical protein